MRLRDVFCCIIRFRVLDYVVCLVIGLAGWLIGQHVRPHCRSFSWRDARIDYPHAQHPAFPTWTLAPITILPGIFYIVSEAVLTYVSYTRKCTVHVESGRGYASRRVQSRTEGASSVSSPTARNTSAGERNRRSAFEPTATTPSTASIPIYSFPEDTARQEEEEEARLVAREVAEPVVAVHNLEQFPWRFFLLRAHYWVLAQCFAVTLAMLIVDCGKVYGGRLRPDFLSRLRAEGFTLETVLTDAEWCQKARGGRLSFPSGHSAYSFAGFVPLVLYVQNCLRCFGGAPFSCRSTRAGTTQQTSLAASASASSALPASPRGTRPSRVRSADVKDRLHGFGGAVFLRFTVGLTPLILPIAVALSRTVDNRHHFDDIVAGAFIGTTTALFAVLLNFRLDGCRGGLMPRYAES